MPYFVIFCITLLQLDPDDNHSSEEELEDIIGTKKVTPFNPNSNTIFFGITIILKF